MPSIERRTTPAFAFDIDGVCVKGKNPIPGAQEAIQLLQQLDIPFIFLTNGGGLTEKDHVQRLASRLDLKLDERQFIQSHTPYHDLVKQFANENILVLGGSGDQIRNVAHEYGFKKVLTSSDFYADMPSLHPFPEMTHDHHSRHGRLAAKVSLSEVDSDASSDEEFEPLSAANTPIRAILVWSSPRDWMFDLQLTLDLLLSTGGVANSAPSPKNGNASLPNNGYLQDGQPMIYFCNPDFQWATQARNPRLAQGAFIEALKGIWSRATNGNELLYQVCGKPTERTYEYGEAALRRWNERKDTEVEVVAQLKQRLTLAETATAETAPAPANVAMTINTTLRKTPRQIREISNVYMIGDNPESDIAGANAFASRFGYAWKSILLETGVYIPGTTPAHIPHQHYKNVKEAVTEILKEEGVIA